MYSKGEGVPEDFVMAYAWAYLAGANDSDATKFKEHLEQVLSPEIALSSYALFTDFLGRVNASISGEAMFIDQKQGS